MEYEKIKELIECMGKSALTSLDIEFPDGVKINMKKEASNLVTSSNVKAQTIEAVSNETILSTSEEGKKEGKIVKSPMVGTFYLKPSPNAESYVSVGTTVKKGTILCIIEAMKLMNEIESEYDGQIAEILVKDGEAVEYGKPLFRII